MSLQDLQEFLTAYRAAFNALDGNRVADLWHTPCGIANEKAGQGALTWWAQEAPMRANHVALCEWYRQCGFARTDFEVLHHQPLGPSHATVHLAWTIWHQDGRVLQAFNTHYQLIKQAQGWRVLLCTAYQENMAAMKG